MNMTRCFWQQTVTAANAKPDARPYALVYLLLTTGIKKSETLGIKLEHIDLDAPNGPQIFIKYASPANRYKERKLTSAR